MVAERMVTNSIIVAGDVRFHQPAVPVPESRRRLRGRRLRQQTAEQVRHPEYKAFAEQMHKYYEAGYIDPALSVGETSNDARTEPPERRFLPDRHPVLRFRL
jgi:hypothetical protein